MVLPLNKFGTVMGDTGDYRNFVQNTQRKAQNRASSVGNMSRVTGTPQSPYTTDQLLETVKKRTDPKKEAIKNQYVQSQMNNSSGATDIPAKSTSKDQYVASRSTQPITGTATTPSGAKVDVATGALQEGPAKDPNQAYRDAYQQYLRTITPSQEETQSREYLNKLLSGSQEAYDKAIAGGDTLGFALGQGAEAQRGFARPIEAASAALEGITGQRTAQSEAARLRAEFEGSLLPKASEPIKVGDSLVQMNPQTGQYEEVFGATPGGLGGGMTAPYVPGASPIIDSYVEIFNRTGKLSDVPDAYRDQVVQALSGQPDVNYGRLQDASIVANKVNDALGSLGFFSSGLAGQFSSWIRSTPAGTLNSIYKTLQAKIGFDELQAMRDASPTGGALGQVSERELDLLSSAIANLDVGLNAETQAQNLQEIADFFEKFQADQILKYEQQAGRELTDDEIRLLLEGREPTFNQVGNTSASNLPQRNNNPGNVKAGGLADKYAIGTDEQGHLIFPDAETGFQALQEDLQAKLSRNSQYLPSNPTIAQLGAVYAEDPNWPVSVARMLGVPLNTPANQVDFNALVQAIAQQEGFYA